MIGENLDGIAEDDMFRAVEGHLALYRELGTPARA